MRVLGLFHLLCRSVHRLCGLQLQVLDVVHRPCCLQLQVLDVSSLLVQSPLRLCELGLHPCMLFSHAMCLSRVLLLELLRGTHLLELHLLLSPILLELERLAFSVVSDLSLEPLQA